MLFLYALMFLEMSLLFKLAFHGPGIETLGGKDARSYQRRQRRYFHENVDNDV